MCPAAVFSENVQSGRLALQREPAQYQDRKVSQKSRQRSVSFANETMRGATQLSDQQSNKTFGELIAAALRKRVGVGRAITVKQLSYALQISEQTVWNLLSGNKSSGPSGRVLMALLTFFDAAFCNEILRSTGCQVAKFNDARADALKKVAEGMEELRRLG